jgi:hypothetical protein
MRLRVVGVRGVLLVAVSSLVGCGDRREVPDVGPQDSRWEEVLERHSAGEISRRDRIRVLFAHDVVGQDRVGQSAAGVVSVEPAISGSVIFATRREIVVSPDRDLEAGRAFVVTVRRGDLEGISGELDRYRFVVRVMEQGFAVDVTGMSPDPARDSSLVLAGAVVTADVDDADRVEQIVVATFRGRALDLSWEHDAGGRRHRFSVAGIVRGDADEELTLAWDGTAIGVASEGERRVTVPAHSLFAVMRVDAVQDQRQYILVQFSDALDETQNLSGLVSLGGTDFTSGVVGNQIRIYPAQPVTGSVAVVLLSTIASRGTVTTRLAVLRSIASVPT